MDLFTVSRITFRVPYVIFVIEHARRRRPSEGAKVIALRHVGSVHDRSSGLRPRESFLASHSHPCLDPTTHERGFSVSQRTSCGRSVSWSSRIALLRQQLTVM